MDMNVTINTAKSKQILLLRYQMFLINIYISFCIKDFDKGKVKRKLKENIFCKGFFLKNGFFHKISTLMDSTVRHRQAPRTSVGQSEGLGLHFLFNEKLP